MILVSSKITYYFFVEVPFFNKLGFIVFLCIERTLLMGGVPERLLPKHYPTRPYQKKIIVKNGILELYLTDSKDLNLAKYSPLPQLNIVDPSWFM